MKRRQLTRSANLVLVFACQLGKRWVTHVHLNTPSQRTHAMLPSRCSRNPNPCRNSRCCVCSPLKLQSVCACVRVMLTVCSFISIEEIRFSNKSKQSNRVVCVCVTLFALACAEYRCAMLCHAFDLRPLERASWGGLLQRQDRVPRQNNARACFIEFVHQPPNCDKRFE